jgi:hypothetical protein
VPSLNDVCAWFEALVSGVSPAVREREPFRLSDLAVPLQDAPKLGQTRTFEVLTGERDRTDKAITDALEWTCLLELRIGYLGFHKDRDLRRLIDADYERIDQALVRAIMRGHHPSPLLSDVDFRGNGWTLLETIPTANHKLASRRYWIRFQVPVAGQVYSFDGVDFHAAPAVPVTSVFGRLGAIEAAAGDYAAAEVSAAAEEGSPNSLAEGTVASQLAELLGYVNAGGPGGDAPVASVFGRTGAVVAEADDYTATQVAAAEAAGSPHSLASGSIATQLASLLALANNLERLHQDPQGWEFSWTDAATITATPSGLDGYGYVPVWNGSELRVERVNSAKTMTLSTSGAGGLHNDHSEAVSTGYDVYWAWGATPGLALFAVPAGTVVNASKLAGLSGGTWTHWSRLAWFARNNAAGDIAKFTGRRKSSDYVSSQSGDNIVMNAGASAVTTAVDLSGHVPRGARQVRLFAFARNDSSSFRQCRLFRHNATDWWFISPNLQNNATANYRDENLVFSLAPGADLTADLYYSWTTAGSNGLSIWVLGWDL